MSVIELHVPPPTTGPAVDAALERVKSQASTFARLSVRARRELCEDIRAAYRRVAEASVLAACAAKGIPEGSQLEGEEWLNGPVLVVRAFRLMARCLSDIERYGVPYIPPERLSRLPDGRLRVSLFPLDPLESALLPRHKGEVHFLPGVTESNLREHQAHFYQKPHDGRLCGILGAGNNNSIPPMDCLQKMFAEGAVCVLKMNPVNAYLGPFLEEAFAPAIARGFFAVLYGGVEQGVQMVQHRLVDEVHLTGSDQTYDSIVWGPAGAEREDRKRRNSPLIAKPVTAELGNITPIIVVPGPYEDRDLAFQAQSLAGMVTNNASFNCNSAKLVISARDWEGRGQFLDSVEKKLSQATVRRAYYPGAEERFNAFTKNRTGVSLLGMAGPGELPYAVIRGVDAKNAEERVFHQEPWCSILSETVLPGREPREFLENAVAFLNEKVWGTLCAGLVVHPGALEQPGVLQAVESAIRELRYGGIAVNTWPAAVYGLGVLPWGGHPSSTMDDIQSGQGFVHNPFMLESVEKAVLRAPVTMFPPPPWIPGHRSLRSLTRKLVDFEDHPTWLKIPGLALDGVRG